ELFTGKNPTVLAHIPTPGNAVRVACNGNFVAAACDSGGLLVIDATTPASAAISHQVALKGAQAVVARGGVGWVGSSSGQILQVDLSSGTVTAALMIGAGIVDLAVEGDYLYALTGDQLYAISLANEKLVKVSAIASPFVAAPNQRLFVGGGI